MKDIKFRVWDGEKLHYGDVIEFTDGIICFHSEIDSIYEGCPIGENQSVDQYTGLKDKNGKEIYEGDILEFDENVWGDSNTNKFEVVWNENTGCWQGYGSFYEWRTYCKVIGNIHEDR
jgi:uncharacterized phage protein (TIGR01671 family)